MSRAFLKDDGADQPEEMPGREASGLPNYVTPAGRAALKAKVAELEAARRALAAEKSEDSFLRQRLRRLQRDEAYYRGQLERAILVDNSGCKAEEVRFGATVSVKDEAGAVREYSVVGEDEADASVGKLWWSSPLGSALLGARAGTKVESGEARLEVVSVRY